MPEVELWAAVAEATAMAEELRDELVTGRRLHEAKESGDDTADPLLPTELAELSVQWELRADMALMCALRCRYPLTITPLVEIGRGENGYLVEAEISLARDEPDPALRLRLVSPTPPPTTPRRSPPSHPAYPRT